MCLPFAGRLGGTHEQLDLARKVGRPNCGFGGSAAHHLGGAGSHAWEGLRLLLGSLPLETQLETQLDSTDRSLLAYSGWVLRDESFWLCSPSLSRRMHPIAAA